MKKAEPSKIVGSRKDSEVIDHTEVSRWTNIMRQSRLEHNYPDCASAAREIIRLYACSKNPWGDVPFIAAKAVLFQTLKQLPDSMKPNAEIAALERDLLDHQIGLNGPIYSEEAQSIYQKTL